MNVIEYSNKNVFKYTVIESSIVNVIKDMSLSTLRRIKINNLSGNQKKVKENSFVGDGVYRVLVEGAIIE